MGCCVVGFVQTVVLSEIEDVDRRLAELQLTRAGLLAVVAVARLEAANATPFHPANAAGTFAYQHGTYALREQFVGPAWIVVRPEGVEAIYNKELNIKVVFSNVDVACSDVHPKPRSAKGAGAERVCTGNLFGDLPQYAPEPKDDGATYYIMVDERGAAELSRPVVSNSGFSAMIERIFISDGSDLVEPDLLLQTDDAVTDFELKVARK